MIKVFLAEDEIVVREGIKNKINWEQEGLSFVGEASDGELAFPMIQKLRPDIVITDIRMPFVDGIELSRMIKKEFPWMKIIILSGHGEFSYAKDAINIGITDYLLKPISAEKLLESVKEVAKTVEEEREQERLLEQFQIEREENRVIEKQKLFFELVCREMPMAEAIERSKRVEIDLTACAYNIVLFQMKPANSHWMSYSEEAIIAQGQMEEVLQKYGNIELFFREADGYALLFMLNAEEEFSEVFDKISKEIIPIIEESNTLEYFFAVGKPIQRLRELPESYHEANRAFAYRYTGCKNEIVFWNTIKGESFLEEENVDFRTLDVGKIDRKIIHNFLRSASVAEIPDFVEEYFLGMGRENMKSLLFRQYIVMDIYFAITAFLEELGQSAENTEQAFGNVGERNLLLSDAEKTKEYIQRILGNALEIRDNLSNKKFNDLLNNAIVYMQENYDREDISLNVVAASVNISPSYFSAIFRQEIGETFIEYLTCIRMEKAKELLMCTNKKTSDIGFEVGYKDSHYFSYIFRKTQNCSPKEFRMRGKEQG